MKRSAPEDSVSHGKVKDKGGCKAYDMIERSMNKVYTGYQEARLLTDPIKNMAKCLTKSNFMLILLLNKFSSCNQLLYESLSSVQRQGKIKRKLVKSQAYRDGLYLYIYIYETLFNCPTCNDQFCLNGKGQLLEFLLYEAHICIVISSEILQDN